MDIEIVDFYPFERQKVGEFSGSLHVRLKDLGIDLRGTFVSFRKLPDGSLSWKFVVPSRKQDGNWFPIINFSNKQKHKEFMKALMYKSKLFILSKMGIKEENVSKKRTIPKQKDKSVRRGGMVRRT